MQHNARAGLNLLTRDLMLAGQGIPQGGIPIPSGTGAEAVTRPPSIAGWTFPTSWVVVPAVVTGSSRGSVVQGRATDVITVIYADTTLALNQTPLVSIAADGSTAVVDAGTPITDPSNGVEVGDFIMFSNASGNAIQEVTGVCRAVHAIRAHPDAGGRGRGIGARSVLQRRDRTGGRRRLVEIHRVARRERHGLVRDPNPAPEPNPKAVIRLQRVRDDGNVFGPFAPCGVGSTDSYDYWPNTLYDTREGSFRDNQNDHDHFQFLGGNMYYVELDVNNLRRYFEGSIGLTGTNVMQIGTENGYLVYFSDRRSNRDAFSLETGEYGFEDVINWGATGVPNGVNDPGEDVNLSGTLDLYGQTPIFPLGVPGALPLDGTARPWTQVGRDISADQDCLSRANPQLFFRRALKLVDGSLGSLPMPGLTVTSENPVYIEGDYNASAGFRDPHAAAAVIADATTLLSNNWTDWDSIDHPHQPSSRPAADTWYRAAIGTGATPHFPQISGTPLAFGTDGGVRHQLRTLEDWRPADVNYLGSLAVLFTSRQANGTFKCCDDVFDEPRGWNIVHDTDFLNPALLPPATPFLGTDVNITGFTHVIRPTN